LGILQGLSFEGKVKRKKQKEDTSRPTREDRGSIPWGPPAWIDLSHTEAKLGDEGAAVHTLPVVESGIELGYFLCIIMIIIRDSRLFDYGCRALLFESCGFF
jgi:hypothetical protein